VPVLLERDARTIILAELESPLLARMTPTEMRAVQRYTQLATTALWVTDGGVIQGHNPEKSLVFGLAKAVMTEHPSFHLCSLDVDSGSGDRENTNSALLIVETEMKFHRNPNAEADTELVEKDGLVYISRYVGDYTENTDFERHIGFNLTVGGMPHGNGALKLQFEKVGKLESFYFDKQDLKPLVEGEVLIDVDAVPLHLSVCAILLSPYPIIELTISQLVEALKGKSTSPHFGTEVAGTVRAVGSGCRLKPEDYVYCVHPHHFDTAVVIHEDQCELLSAQDLAGDLLGQVHPLVTSLHLAGLLRLESGNQVLIDCEETQLAYMFAQVALLRCSEVYVACRSGSVLDKLQRLGTKARLVD
jgi:hypothetical protein